MSHSIARPLRQLFPYGDAQMPRTTTQVFKKNTFLPNLPLMTFHDELIPSGPEQKLSYSFPPPVDDICLIIMKAVGLTASDEK